MSGVSPAAILFDVNGIAVNVYNNTALAVGQPLLPMAGVDGYNNVTRYILSSAVGGVSVTDTSNNVVVLSNATISASGSDIFTAQFFGTQQINLIVNSTVQATGTSPTLAFTIQEVDPGNGTTTFGNSATTTTLTAGNTPGVFTATLPLTHSSAFRVSWTVTGTTPVFAGMYVTVTTKSTPDTQVISGSITATNPSVGPDGGPALVDDTQVGGIVTTAAPTYTTGNLNALSLTTVGGLRIDGTYPAGTTNANAPDVGNSGGYVTTAAPTYTTGQLNPLSLDTAGNLRTSVNNTVTVTGASASTFNNQSVGADGATALGFDTQVGGKVTTAAPTYTTGNLDALSLTTLGGLRIDGVYATGTANGTAADAIVSGGYVTTAAPTYTTGQLNALSLDTAGNLRTSVNNTVTVTGAAASTFNNQSVGADGAAFLGFDTQVGGRVVAGPPTYTVGNLNALTLDVGGNLRVVTNKGSTSAVTSVAQSNTNVQLLASNTSRIFASVYNNGSQKMYIKLGTTANTTNSYSIQLLPNSYWEVPVDYTGEVDAIWGGSGGGNALLTEVTP